MAWARKMEKLLEEAISASAPGQFEVRAIECRMARCAVEVAAPHEFYLGQFAEDSEISRSLYGPKVGDLGFETDANGDQVIVTTLGYERM